MSRPASIISSIALAAGILISGYLFGGMYAGWAMAQIDTHRSVHRVAVIGLPQPWERELDRVYAEKYHVERNRIAYCIVSTWDRDYSNGYNQVAHAAIEKKYGGRFRADAFATALHEYMRTHDLDDERKKGYEEMLREIESR